MSKWTDGRRRSFITSVIRAGLRRWPEKYKALEAAYTSTKTNEATGRKAKHYRCNGCKEEFVSKDIQLDHIEPVVPITGFTNWDDYINRMYILADKFQTLCKPCHSAKSKKENVARTKARKKNDD